MHRDPEPDHQLAHLTDPPFPRECDGWAPNPPCSVEDDEIRLAGLVTHRAWLRLLK